MFEGSGVRADAGILSKDSAAFLLADQANLGFTFEFKLNLMSASLFLTIYNIVCNLECLHVFRRQSRQFLLSQLPSPKGVFIC